MAFHQKPSKTPSLSNLNHLGSSLHEAAANGITCDYPNNKGETPLFCACLKEKLNVASLLLKHGADPNARSCTGITAVHAACYTCNSVLLSMLLEAGGDLRLHDDTGKGIMHFINEQVDSVKKAKMLIFIEQVRSSTLAISNGKKETERTHGMLNAKKERKRLSIGNLLKFKSNYRPVSGYQSGLSSGFGKLYVSHPQHSGIIATIPLVKDNSLEHDESGCTYDNGSFMVMESMYWNGLPVTVKRLHQKPRQGGNVNLLINENEHMARLRHPSILLIMAVYQTDNLEGLQLVYERVCLGSLYSYLYNKFNVDKGTPPWHGMHASDIEVEVTQKKRMLEIGNSMKEPFSTILRHGLAVEPMDRGLTLEQFINNLTRVLMDPEIRSVNSNISYPHLKAYNSHSAFSMDKKWKSLKSEDKVDISDTDELNNSSTVTSVNQNGKEGSGNVHHKNYLSIFEQQVTPFGTSPKNKKDKYWENYESTQTTQSVETEPSMQQCGYNQKEISFKTKQNQSQTSTKEAIVEVRNGSEISPGGDAHFEGMGVKFTLDIAKSKYFETVLTKPKLTSTPNAGTSSTNLLTDKKEASMIQEHGSKNSGTVTEKGDGENLTNPFKKEYENLKSRNLTTAYSAVTLRQPYYSVPTNEDKQSEIKTMSAFNSVSSTKGQNYYDLTTKKNTVCGTLLQDRFSQSSRQSSVLNDNLEKTGEQDNASKKTGPIYLYPRRNMHQIFSGARYSCTNLPRMHKSRITPSSLDTTKTCHDLLVSNNVGYHAYKPASHVSSYTTYTYESAVSPTNNMKAAKRPDSRAINTTICNSPERLSPLEKKDEWYAETGGIKKIIASYQNLIKEHVKKQEVLVMKTRQKQEMDLSKRCAEQTQPEAIKSKMHQELSQLVTETIQKQVLTKATCTENMAEVTPKRPIEALPSHDARSSGDATFSQPHHVQNISGVTRSPCLGHLVARIPGSLEQESETDQEVSDIVDNVLLNVYSEVIEKYTHPDCPHKADIVSEIKGLSKLSSANAQQLKHTAEIAIQTDNTDKDTHTDYEDERIETEDIYIDDDFNCNSDNQIHMSLQGNKTSNSTASTNSNNGSSTNILKDTDIFTDIDMNKGLPSPAGGDNQINTMSVNPQMFTQICFSEEEIVG
ncbi:hypothetical protein LSH36_127g04019 [Paralvinella palmiformis]|uniref:Uncharacterized protein n=1 Tax=Paralvinella palmiformis TaxID=53620 RepID=A0AAD9JXX4_9ANNE|nr:hypothetical protein LSH36_127g04019 [Paralvinella palmiformis]